eukprot:5625517-Pyramimonas_sp.AAC.1
MSRIRPPPRISPPDRGGILQLGWQRDSMAQMQAKFGADEKDTDDIRRMFTETSPVVYAPSPRMIGSRGRNMPPPLV